MTEPTRPLAVVTGASSGIGRELADRFARNGFDVLIAAEDAELDAAARELEGTGAAVTAVRVDLATYDGVEELYDAIRATGRTPEALAVNAGVGVSGPFAENDLADELRLVNLNVTSAVHLTRRVLPAMLERGAGRILLTSSIAAVGPGPFQATYAASKAFLRSFGGAIREELGDTGVTVTTLMPGPTDTEFFERAEMEDTRLGAMENKDDPADVARQGFEALMAGKAEVVGGSLRNKVQTTASRVMSEPVKAKMQRKLTEPGSAD
ncbi:SDR family NAD(P)-dependent oxidoreductase [Actinoallomurus rhizosphaericola]|uniref:SDR family NAD(P)-dependent oxidoreductase n=1 Tax=Actinoallomurus rhizosphaericola TaxID=2952536 RepID=UPI002090B586|nr:SDR family NAD(P)-dependent oxidoreductase [Actinoallomurus rhizosphaericola]MCO5994166.1 SDR family NAD(P)-dependent oxidoreductase [Actinoallomurus rhizosphaericola]